MSGSPSHARVRLPSIRPEVRLPLSACPAPVRWRRAGRAGRAGRPRQPSSRGAGAWPAALPSGLLLRSELHYLIGKPFQKGAAEPLGMGVGRAASAPSWQPRCQTRAGIAPPGVCLLSDCWESSWLLSAFRGDWAGLQQAGGVAQPMAGQLPGGQRICFKSQNQIARHEGSQVHTQWQRLSPDPTVPGLSFPSGQPSSPQHLSSASYSHKEHQTRVCR